MLIAAKVKKVQFVDQAVALEQVEGAVDGDAMDARVEFPGAFENGSGVQMTLRFVHHFNENFALARQAHAPLGEGLLQTAGTLLGVDSFAGGDAMCRGGHDCGAGGRATLKLKVTARPRGK